MSCDNDDGDMSCSKPNVYEKLGRKIIWVITIPVRFVIAAIAVMYMVIAGFAMGLHSWKCLTQLLWWVIGLNAVDITKREAREEADRKMQA